MIACLSQQVCGKMNTSNDKNIDLILDNKIKAKIQGKYQICSHVHEPLCRRKTISNSQIVTRCKYQLQMHEDLFKRSAIQKCDLNLRGTSLQKTVWNNRYMNIYFFSIAIFNAIQHKPCMTTCIILAIFDHHVWGIFSGSSDTNNDRLGYTENVVH